jgi:hypothetical protein
MTLAQLWPGRVQLLTRSQAEATVLQIVLGDTARITPDLRDIHLRKLAMMTVPSLGPSVNELVAVRRSSEDFSAWRTALAIALTQVQQLEDDDEGWPEKAAAIVDAELETVRERVQSATKRALRHEAWCRVC